MSDMNKDLNTTKKELSEDVQAPVVETAQTPDTKKKKKLSNYFHSVRFKKGGLATAFTIGFIVIVVLLNIVFSLLEDRFPSLKIDMTTNKIYSLSEDALEAAKKVDIPTTIYILASEETAKDDSLLSKYGLQYSQVAVLAEKAAESNKNISVEYVDIEMNPTFASAEKYANYTLVTGSVIVENDRRIRVLGMSDLYGYEYESAYSMKYYMQVDSALTNALMQVTADTIPIVSVASGSHNEMLSGDAISTFETLLASNSFEIQTFDLLTEDVPENTSILLLPTPSTDYTEEELAKLDAYMSETKAGNCSLWVAFHTTQPDLPNLSAFMSEWGLAVPTQVIKETDSSHMVAPEPSYLISNLVEQDEAFIGNTDDYGYFVTPQCRPVQALFKSNDSIVTYTLAQTYETTYLESTTGSTSNTSDLGVQDTVVLGQRIDTVGGEYYYKSVVAFGSSFSFTSSYLSTSTFGNATYLVDLAKYCAGTADSDVGVSTKQVETNTYDITITTAARNIIGLGLFVVIIPLALIIAGVVVYLKRRHL